MASLGTVLVTNMVTRMLVCVDATLNQDLSGRLFNPYMPNLFPYSSVNELITAMDRFYDYVGFPQTFFTPRSFREGNDPAPRKKRRAPREIARRQEEYLYNTCRGELATLDIRVMFRQSASWQGVVTWLEKGLRCEFRSTLELLKLLESAAQLGKVEGIPAEWQGAAPL